MKLAKTIKKVRVGSVSVTVKHYADGRYGFDYRSPAGERVKVRLQDSGRAIARADEMAQSARGGKVERWVPEDEYAEFLRFKAEKKAPVLIPSLVDSLLEARRSRGVTPATVRELSSTLTHFAKDFPGCIRELDRAAVLRWLDGRNVSPRRWNNMRNAIVALHRHARGDGLLAAELTPVERIPRRKIRVVVGTYEPTELERFLSVVEEEWLPFFVFGAFCGIRPEEISPDQRNGGWKPGLQWQDIKWHRKVVDVPPEVAKDRRRRFAPLTPAAAAFLLPWKDKTGPVCPRKAMHKYRLRWAEDAKVPWKNDGLRHSFASYRLALTKDMAALSLEMGNSPHMIHRHYLDLKHASEGKAWFAIRPKVPICPTRTTARSPKIREELHAV